MKFASTRDPALAVSLARALVDGLAPDGGLYVPQALPAAGAATADAPLAALAPQLLAPYFEGDALASSLAAISSEAFDFPAPLRSWQAVPERLSLLELFHGPTAAFKDFGARFLAATMQRLRTGATRPLNILVATSGDTGGAVAAAFYQRPGIEVSVLFPKGLVSPTQELQLTCWGDNVHSYRVKGTFDDCQRLVKEAFVDAALKSRFELSSANSINLGRLLPQAVYYAATSLAVHRAHGIAPDFIIPSGNLGNSVACVWARKLGLPIGRIILAHNANRTVPDFLQTGEWQPRASVPTLASAMDVGTPSNMERLRALFPDIGEVRKAVRAESVTDAEINARITRDFGQYGKLWCPHTATAAEVFARMSASDRSDGRWILVATAHPAKFREIVEPLTGSRIEMPESLGKLFSRPVSCTDLEPELPALTAALQNS